MENNLKQFQQKFGEASNLRTLIQPYISRKLAEWLYMNLPMRSCEGAMPLHNYEGEVLTYEYDTEIINDAFLDNLESNFKELEDFVIYLRKENIKFVIFPEGLIYT
jgi:hypothetical protein